MNPYSPTSIQALTYKTPQQIISEAAAAGTTAPATSVTSAPGAMQYSNGGQASMVSPAGATPVVATTATTPAYTSAAAVPVAEPTIGSTLGTSTAGATTPTSTLRNPTYEKEGFVIDEDKIRRQQTKLFQREIDATNQVYKQLLNEARVEGQGRLGSQTAQSARGGLLGSDFGSAQEQKVRDVNTGITTALQNERIAKIGAIQGKIREAVASELTRKREELQTSSKARKELKTNNLKLAASAFLTQGIDPMTLSQEELMAIGQEAGLTPNEIINQYVLDKAEQDTATAKAELGTRKTEAEISKIEADIAKGKVIELAEGGMLYNTETGETFKNPKTYAPTAGSAISSVIGTDSVTQIHQFLQSNRGADGYTATNKYLDELGKYVSLGGDPKDFLKEYDPNVYINPKDETRSFLQTYMKTTPAEAVQKELTSLEQLQQLQEMQDKQLSK